MRFSGAVTHAPRASVWSCVALSGVSERPIITLMTTTVRPQQRYDHRLRGLVQRTGDVTIATDLGSLAREPLGGSIRRRRSWVTREAGRNIEPFDLGLVGGFGVEFVRGLIEARYTHGLLRINTDDNEPNDRLNNRVFSVTVGFRLR